MSKWLFRAVLLLGCCMPAESFAIPISPISWTQQGINYASTSVEPNNNVALRVFRESWASADANLGNLRGRLHISFDYSVTSEGWWENPHLSLGPMQLSACRDTAVGDWFNSSACGSTTLAYANNGLNVSPYSTTYGTFTTSISVAGQTHLIFSLIPNNWSLMPDHYNTYFNVTNLRLDLLPDHPQPSRVPEPSAFVLSAIGLLVLVSHQWRHKHS
jgi:hypothetical protein